ncbi:13915_t:CDS:2 [Cetraspora pellucida]|uniref:13915_t:CDS:1 n=1 Tax=Cetraspora pellucida TaxID=1433469 RepID=A0A9N9IIS3_9GLOM|nr:13915_t:CDS:2 [Cetraspora pellucida]
MPILSTPSYGKPSESYKQVLIYIDKDPIYIDENEAEVSKLPTQSEGGSKTIHPRSLVWSYFKTKDASAICNFCGTKLVYQDGTTSNLKKHLKIHRSKVPELKSLNVEQGSVSIIKHNQPFLIAEDEKLRLIFKFLDPRVTALSADSIKRHIVHDFEVDGDKSFIAVTIHYLNASWKLKNILLNFISINESHIGAVILNTMEVCLQEIGIIPKLIAITCDNAASNDRFLQEFAYSLSQLGIQFDSTQQSMRCFSYILNLAVQDMLDIARTIMLDSQLKFQYFEELRWSAQLIDQIKDIIKNKYENQYTPVSDQDVVNSIVEPSATNIIL